MTHDSIRRYEAEEQDEIEMLFATSRSNLSKLPENIVNAQCELTEYCDTTSRLVLELVRPADAALIVEVPP